MSAWLVLIAQYGIPAAYQIWQTFKDGRDPTEADWQNLLKLNENTAQQYVDAAKQEALVKPQ